MKLNIGCGKNFKPDYCNIDLYDDLIADRKMSALDLEFDDYSCQEIQANHLIEHLGLYQSIYALSEFYRILEQEGKLILETPDLETTFSTYLKSDYEEKINTLNWVYGLPHEGLEHKFCFPPQLLHELLEKVGFENVTYTNFYNEESIPTIKFIASKQEVDKFGRIFQDFSHIRKKMMIKKVIDFKDLFVTKEQEDLLNFLLIETISFRKHYDLKKYLNSVKKSLMYSPQIVKIFIEELKNTKLFSNLKRTQILEIAELLLKSKFHEILLDSLMKTPLIPGSQKVAFSSIESFGVGVIDKLLFSGSEKEKMTEKLKELSQNLKNYSIPSFSSNIIRRKSLDFFYLGIKSFYKQDYEIALKDIITAIKMYRDNFLYFWNLAKVLANLNLKERAIRYYKKTLRCLNLTQVTNKKQIKMDIKGELNSFKTQKVDFLKLEPILTLEKYELNKLIQK